MEISEVTAHVLFKANVLSHSIMSDFFVTQWTIAHQVPLSAGFSRQENWSGLPFSSPVTQPRDGNSSYPTQPRDGTSLNWKVDSLSLSHQGSSIIGQCRRKSLIDFLAKQGALGLWQNSQDTDCWLVLYTMQQSWRGVNPSTGWPRGRDCYPTTNMQPLLSAVKTSH